MPGNINEDTWKRAKDAVKRKPDEDENSYRELPRKPRPLVAGMNWQKMKRSIRKRSNGYAKKNQMLIKQNKQ